MFLEKLKGKLKKESLPALKIYIFFCVSTNFQFQKIIKLIVFWIKEGIKKLCNSCRNKNETF